MKRIAILLGAAALVLSIAPSTFAASKPTQTIVQIATANGNFKTLLAAVGCADPAVGAALSGKGPLTVFAPTDAAFKLAGLTPANVCTALPKATLTKILEYHVVKGSVLADKALPAGPGKINTITTLLGQRVWSIYNGYLFTTSGSVAHIMVKGSLFNIMATNGVIHVIDRVLKPAL
jgi:uncharacterized surface protein with fasciclin (FAS1) repeats